MVRRSYKTELAESEARNAALEERLVALEALVTQGQSEPTVQKSKNRGFLFRHGDITYDVRYERQYTWVLTSDKPSDLVLKALRGCDYANPPNMLRDGPRGWFSRGRMAWAYHERVDPEWVKDIVTGKIPTKSE